ncbi:hypothetical protein HAX54_028500 [Datura stramonium]|uniref:Uncharacterized protein n=1 Tax=Datura stramonium TaxID=4076 RepID=A0ABS8S9L3_DATST|nr:hypothetical protein [Datura stramonium]
MVYFNDDDATDATDYLAKLENPEDHYTWVASLIAVGTPYWATYVEPIHKSDLNIHAKHWMGFVCSRLTPSKNDNNIPTPERFLSLVSCWVAKMTAQNNTKLNSLIEHILDIIKRDINNTLAPVHPLIQNLEQREIIAALLADIGRVKWDIQQIQSDLNIFNTPIPEEEDLEDERVETDEELFEDVHRIKGIDEKREVQMSSSSSWMT